MSRLEFWPSNSLPSPSCRMPTPLARFLTRTIAFCQYGLGVTVCESHTIPGGCAHSFEREGFKFDSGPSIFSGFTGPVPNPLKQVRCTGNVDGDTATARVCDELCGAVFA